MWELDCNLICVSKVPLISKPLEGERTIPCYMPAFLHGHSWSQNMLTLRELVCNLINETKVHDLQTPERRDKSLVTFLSQKTLTQAGHTKCYMPAFLQRDTWSQNSLTLQELDCNLIKVHDLQTLGRKYKTCLDIWSHLVTFLSQKTLTLWELECNLISVTKVAMI